MESVAFAIDSNKSQLLRSTRLKISEWLDFKNRGSTVRVTVYLEFSDSERVQDLTHIYLIIPRISCERIIFPTQNEIMEENKILQKRELSRTINDRGRFILPIFIKTLSPYRESKDHVLFKIDLGNFETDDSNMNRFQFHFRTRESIRRSSWLSTFLTSSWDWRYETSINPLTIDWDEFPDITQIRTDLELWVMIEPAMYNSVSDLNIQSTRPFDRLVIMPEDIAKKYERESVHPGTLCVRWFFSDFSESGVGDEIRIKKRRSAMEGEQKHINQIKSEPHNFFLVVNQILNDSRITCVDFEYISKRLQEPEFSKFLDILFQILYHRDNPALSRLEEFVNILERLQDLKYGTYYLHMYRLLQQMLDCNEVQDIIGPNIRIALDEFLEDPKILNKSSKEFLEELNPLINLIEHFHYYNIPERVYQQKKDILDLIKKLIEMAENKLINPEKYLIAGKILPRWEDLVEKEFEQLVGTPRLNVELIAKKLFTSDRIHIIFDVTNISDVPMVNLTAGLLPSEQYIIFELEKRETHVRQRLTKSDDMNKRIFSPEFVINPLNFHKIQIKLEIKFFTEDGKKFTRIFDEGIELIHDTIEFKEIEPNPYIVGGPIRKKKMFYGRKDIFMKIRETIVGYELINQAVVYGQYRIGKTSALYQLMNVLTNKYIPVLTVIYKFESDSDLLSSWSTQIANAVKNRTNDTLEIPDYKKLSRPYKEFQDFLTKIIEKLDKANIVFMIDDYDLLDDLIQNREIDNEVQELLEWMIRNERIQLIMAGRLPIESLKVDYWKKITRPFVQIKLPPLDRESAKRLIIEPVEACLKYDESAIEKILRLTNNHPYLIQLCCHVLVNFHNSKRKTVIRYDDVEENIPDIIELGSPGLSAMILTDATDEDKVVLRVMAKFLRLQTSISERELVVRIREHNPQIGGRNIINSLSNLEKREVIRSVTEKEMRNYRFTCEIFRYWIEAKMEYIDRFIPPFRTSEKIM